MQSWGSFCMFDTARLFFCDFVSFWDITTKDNAKLLQQFPLGGHSVMERQLNICSRGASTWEMSFYYDCTCNLFFVWCPSLSLRSVCMTVATCHNRQTRDLRHQTPKLLCGKPDLSKNLLPSFKWRNISPLSTLFLLLILCFFLPSPKSAAVLGETDCSAWI